jgi:hypothetical protein
MCATGAQNTIQQQDIATMQQYDAQQAQQYANQSELYASVKSVLDPILKAGPGQPGFSGAEETALDAQAVEGTAANYRAGAKAVGENLAAEGGGDNPLPTGAQTEMKEQVANSAAAEESQQETQIQEANYQTGRQNFQNAEEGELAIASGENPIGYAGATNSASSNAGTEANAIASEDTSWINSLIGAAGAVGGGWATGGFKTP